MDRHKLLNKINQFNLLQDNWDSYGGKAPTVETINLAREIAISLNELDTWFVAPCGDGSILFESEKGFIEVEGIVR